ncbi:DsbE family thiol:disulfide interchange protein [Reinekea marinisedimentorum]|uniref:Cytochrome c biogenesis protein CcmG/thiol:disulfide interchange protein DsbE n=1 Tax=Reinekea marinisedimentorum TaxID=230495 RepID=A0A4R3I6V7_9GAMM|nr:DsbE family thiol:disulfide interchange protein [Reinekea marinisedimentorum]TCS41423.1 cytochrome c biogenesis protein CcmG/thiol:disulfide interchange protein DsbE [Reinekea marinisedimentorum]
MKIRPLVILPLVFVFALFALFGYALLSGVDPKEVPSALTGKALPGFQLASLQDENTVITREEIIGEPMLMNIWATWCSSCKYEHPVLNALSADGVKIIGINYKDERDLALKWLQDYADPYALDIYDPNGDLGFDLGVTGAPETFFIDSKGQVQYRYQGPITHEIWQQSLKAIYDEMV